MEHLNIENQIHQIREALVAELKQANAIDDNGKATNKEVFEKIMDKKIAEIMELEPKIADEAGVAQDRYASNIFFHQLELLNEMRKNGSISHENDSYSLKVGQQNEEQMLKGRDKKGIFRNGINKLFAKFRQRKHSIENVR